MNRLRKILFFGIAFILIPASQAFGDETILPQDIYKNADFVCKVLMDYKIEAFDQIKNSTVTFSFPEENKGSCAAISLKGKSRIVTAAHLTVLSREEILNLIVRNRLKEGSNDPAILRIKKIFVYGKVYFKNNPGKAIEVEAEHIDTDLDLATLTPKNPEILEKIKGVPLGKEKIEVADSVFSIGNPQELNFIFMSGKISAVLSVNNYKHILTEPMIDFGNSGGPLLDKNGRCVGIAVRAFFSYNIPFSLFVHRDNLKSYLEKNNKK